MRNPSEQSYLSVDWQNAIDWNHHLNRDLVGWWLNAPHRQGGLTFRDVVGRNDATISGLPAATAWATPEDREGGWGSLNLIAADHADTNMADAYKPTGAMTLTVWCKGQASGTTQGSCFGTQGGSGSRGFTFGPNNGGDVRVSIAENSTTVHSTTTTGHDSAAWTHYTGVFVPSTSLTLYRNGIQIAQNTTSIPATQYQANSLTPKIGNRGDLTSPAFFIGLLDDIRMVAGAYTPSEVMEYYEQSRTFYPDVLRRWGRLAVGEVAAGGAIDGALSGISSLFGTLGGNGALAGPIAAVATFAATLSAVGSLDGSDTPIAGVATFSGTLSAKGSLAGTVTASSTFSGTLGGTGTLSGATPGTSTFAGTLLGRGSRVGTTTLTSTFGGTLVPTTQVGTISVVASVSGTLLGTGARVGTLAGAATFGGTLRGPLGGAVAGTATFVGTAFGRASVEGTLAATSTFASTLLGRGTLVGTFDLTANFSGTLVELDGPILGTLPVTSTFTGTLTGIGTLVGSLDATATFSATEASTRGGGLDGRPYYQQKIDPSRWR